MTRESGNGVGCLRALSSRADPSKTTTNNQFYKTNAALLWQRLVLLLGGACNGVKLLAMDILAIATMKNAAKCDT